MTILVILVILILIICGVLAYQKMNLAEGFDLGANTELSTCPLQSISYLDRNGDTLCCETSLSPEGECGKPLCALAKRRDMPSCKAMLDEANQKAASICPPSLPNYYTDGKAVTGCTDGALNNERTAPISSFSKTCKVYPDTPVKINGKMTSYTLNDTTIDSCSVQRRLEITKQDMKTLFGPNFRAVEAGNYSRETNKPDGAYTLFVTYQPSGNTGLQNCQPKDDMIFEANNMPLDSRFNEAAKKAYIDFVKQGLNDDCSLHKAIYIDKESYQAYYNKKMDYKKAHPELTVNI